MPSGTEITGVIVRGYGLYYDVTTPHGILRCTLRGTIKRERRKTTPAAPGDRVRTTLTTPGTPEGEPAEGVIEEIMPRTRSLSRLARGTTDSEQVIVANPDQLVAVFAVHEPEPHPRLVDRFLLIAEARGLEAVICVNKLDLANKGDVERTFAPFRMAGYPIVTTSAHDGSGLDALRATLQGKLSAFAGPSGVGKSSLLNALSPERAAEKTGEISSATGKGKHTTTWTTVFQIGPDTYVADTPGIRALQLWGVDFEELDRLYPEFRPYLGACHYDDCRHLNEPDCAVRAALDEGVIHPDRYASYCAFKVGGD
ncbi:MAG TPA: ribosome small subunit-dependent GTPase A, partial [Thermomicrobiales bacterium]|nr:ribosome small subunit-dependent GTPase A [Thermomicrobiales bacterium]